jgi:hypothetical protein
MMSSQHQVKPLLIPSDQAAPLFGYDNTMSFLRTVKKEGIPHVRVNSKRIMFDPDALQDWIRSRTVGKPPRKVLSL